MGFQLAWPSGACSWRSYVGRSGWHAVRSSSRSTAWRQPRRRICDDKALPQSARPELPNEPQTQLRLLPRRRASAASSAWPNRSARPRARRPSPRQGPAACGHQATQGVATCNESSERQGPNLKESRRATKPLQALRFDRSAPRGTGWREAEGLRETRRFAFLRRPRSAQYLARSGGRPTQSLRPGAPQRYRLGLKSISSCIPSGPSSRHGAAKQ